MSTDALQDYLNGLDWPTARLIEDLFIAASRQPAMLPHRPFWKLITPTLEGNTQQWRQGHRKTIDFDATCKMRGCLLITLNEDTRAPIRDHATGIINAYGHPPAHMMVANQPDWTLSWIPKRYIHNVHKTLEQNPDGRCAWAHTFIPSFQLNQIHSNPPWHHLPKTHLMLLQNERVVRVAPCTVKAFADVWRRHAPLD